MEVSFIELRHHVLKLILLTLLCSTANITCYRNQIFANELVSNNVTVSNTKEFLENIKPNTNILLRSGEYRFDDAVNTKGDFFRIDNSRLIISKITNLKITGEKKTFFRNFLNKDNIFVIENCSDITIDNIVFEYANTTKFHFSPSVIFIVSSDSIYLKNLAINGHSSRGLQISGSKKIELSDSLLKNIKYQFIGTNNSNEIFLNNVIFDKMKEGHLAVLYESKIYFNDCKIINNRFTNGIIKIKKYSFVTIKNSTFLNNESKILSINSNNSIWLANNIFQNNKLLDDKLNTYQIYNKRRNILYYFWELSRYLKYDYSLFFKDGKWLTLDTCGETSEALVDIKNGYVALYGVCDKTTVSLALFKSSSGENFIGEVTTTKGLFFPEISKISFYKFNSDTLKPENVTDEIFQLSIEDFQLEGTDKKVFTNVSNTLQLDNIPIFEITLPRFGTNITAKLILNKGFIEYIAKNRSHHENDKPTIRRYQNSLKTDSITLKWDRTLSRFVKQNSL